MQIEDNCDLRNFQHHIFRHHITRQTREHKHEKKDSKDTDFPDSSVWLWDVDNDKKMEKEIKACEMWIWRKMQRISWTEKKTNESVGLRMEIGIEE